MTVHRSRSSASSTVLGSKRGTTERHPPYRTLTLITDESPNTWKNGRTARLTSSRRAPNRSPAIVQFMYSWKWVSSAPLGVVTLPPIT